MAPELRRLLLVLLIIACVPRAWAQDAEPAGWPPPEGRQALLLTYGPGPVYWQRFGHNAIWLREPSRGLDHSFNFGFFDFEQESFLRRFLQGRMLYFSAALPAQRELDFYRGEGRSIRVQALELTDREYERLRDHLLERVRPENRDYLYDYYLDNCSTRVRDALDLALGGALGADFRARPAPQTFRDHTRRATQSDYWYYLGLELALGMPVDRDISQWDAMVLPSELADRLAQWRRPGAADSPRLVGEDRLLYAGEVPALPERPEARWPRYLGLALLILLGAVLAVRLGRPVLVEGLLHAWFLTAATLGVGLVLLWAFTDHHAAHPNFNLLLCNPLLALSLWARARRGIALLAAVGALGAVGVAVVGEPQYLADVAAFSVPLHLAAAWWLWRGTVLSSRGA
ncbi:MAG: DUF4105 domain-containing protein [Gammaproteobacteria bacterium]